MKKCPPPEVILEHLYGEIEPGTETADHILKCERCQLEVGKKSQVLEMLDKWEIEPSDLQVSKPPVEVPRVDYKPEKLGEILNIAQLAGYLQIREEDVMSTLGEIPHFTILGKVRFKKTSIDAWIQDREVGPGESRDLERSNIIDLSTFLEKRII
ncbi:helix-turn-helix domain-containing protein [bacterium]|jgi:hypothetical protein|nr:helix-turn-helix domain-containing protein [bacterium]